VFLPQKFEKETVIDTEYQVGGNDRQDPRCLSRNSLSVPSSWDLQLELAGVPSLVHTKPQVSYILMGILEDLFEDR
jgi:hypothetical protein